MKKLFLTTLIFILIFLPALTIIGQKKKSATADYLYWPPQVGNREFRIVEIPFGGLDTGTGSGQRYVINFNGNDGYLLLTAPATPITGMVDISTNAKTIVLHGADFAPEFASQKTGSNDPPANRTVGKVLDIYTTGANNPEIYLFKLRFNSALGGGGTDWNAGDAINFGGTASSDQSKYPLLTMEQCWFDDLWGWESSTIGHTDIVKTESGPNCGMRWVRSRAGCSYQFFIFFNRHNETYGAVPGAIFEFIDNQFYSLSAPADWSPRTHTNLYFTTSYTNQVSNGKYHPFFMRGITTGNEYGYGNYVDMSQSNRSMLSELTTAGGLYAFEQVGDILVGIPGNPPSNRNNNMDFGNGIIYKGLHPQLDNTNSRSRPVMRTETGSDYRITTLDQLKAITTSLNNIEISKYEEGMIIMPNPTSGVVKVQIDQPDAVLEALDLTGKTLIIKRIVGMKAELDLSSLEDGIYFIKSTNNKYNYLKKVIIKNN